MNEKVVCYHHNDGDGKMSAAVVASVYPDAEFREINYNHEFSFDGLEDKMVIVVDFSFPDMALLEKSCQLLCWIDHHESAMKDQKELWDSEGLDGLREIGKCGAWLAWEWFYPHEAPPTAIKLVNDYDLWIKALPETDRFNERISLHKFNKLFWVPLLKDEKRVKQLIQEGGILLNQKKKRVNDSIQKGIEHPLYTKSGQKDKVFWINSPPMDVSLAGSEILKKGYDIAIMYFVDKDKVIFGMRSNKYDVSKIALDFGGGGHKTAAGFQLPLEEAFVIIRRK